MNVDKGIILCTGLCGHTHVCVHVYALHMHMPIGNMC